MEQIESSVVEVVGQRLVELEVGDGLGIGEVEARRLNGGSSGFNISRMTESTPRNTRNGMQTPGTYVDQSVGPAWCSTWREHFEKAHIVLESWDFHLAALALAVLN